MANPAPHQELDSAAQLAVALDELEGVHAQLRRAKYDNFVLNRQLQESRKASSAVQEEAQVVSCS